ncbi:MAG: FAD:protein FMN transferase [Candidatus Hydrogenedentes bacterium]|nr:FAD:protein FMN transferase [Candidatus Hydrogenedentota bacterium]
MCFVVIPLLIALSGCQREDSVAVLTLHGATFDGPTMGTHYTVKVRGVESKEAVESARQSVSDILNRIDSMMSTYKPGSELSRFNQHQSTEPFNVSPEMIEIFQTAREVSDATNGAFDITVGPIVNAWGFGPEKHTAPPTDAEIAALLPRVGYKMVTADAASSTIRKERPDIYCDLSGIAQGYAADQIAKALDDLGISDYMIDISGEFRTRGKNDTGQPWQIGIERPDAPERTAQLVVPLSNMSLATSGDYRNYRVENGVRLSHEIDPATGRPVQHKLASATIVTEQCAYADAYATALMVLGPEKALALAEDKGLAVYLLVRNEQGGFDEVQSTAFKERIAWQETLKH